MTHSLLKPATLDLAETVGRGIALATIKGDSPRLATLSRIYGNMLPEAKARADMFAGWSMVEGGVQS